jgi:hypothetical protein
MEPDEKAPETNLTAEQLVEMLERRFLDLDDHLAKINKEREVLTKINARMDNEIEKGAGLVTQLRERADALEVRRKNDVRCDESNLLFSKDENEKKRAENAALRERIRKMNEILEKM